ncbi:MAG: 50S ribosomal protein L31 [Verrucomicrobiae bacterium]|nr:50S ribosomal protein L31 [Verrucomicrobiae bacterium]
MRADIHPDYKEATIQCTCGAVYSTRSTSSDIRVGICAACHPFFTGEQRFIDTAGRVDKFAKRYGTVATAGGTVGAARRTKAPKLSEMGSK